MSTKVDKMPKKLRSGKSQKVVLKLLNHRKSSLSFAFFLGHTHTRAMTPPRRVTDTEKRMFICSCPVVLAFVKRGRKVKLNQLMKQWRVFDVIKNYRFRY